MSAVRSANAAVGGDLTMNSSAAKNVNAVTKSAESANSSAATNTDAQGLTKIALLGATGSIGTQTLDVVRKHPDKFKIVAVSANKNVDALTKIAQEFNVEH